MAADFDDTTEDFFDNLVNSDDDDDRPVAAAAKAEAEAEAEAGDLAALTLSDPKPDDHPTPAPLPEDPKNHPTTEAVPDPGPASAPPGPAPLPVSHPSPRQPHPATDAVAEPEPSSAPPPPPAAAAPALKQAQWNDFGADPFGDLPPGEAFFGDTSAEDQGAHASILGASSASEPDRSFSAGADANAAGAAGLPDYSFYGGTDSNANSHLDSITAAAAGYGDHQSTDAQFESADPRYLESLYPGWKYNDATQQWYQVDTLSVQQITAETSAVALLGTDHVQQQQQQLSASYLQNNSLAEAADEPTETEATPQPKPVTEDDDQPVPAPHEEPAHPEVGPAVAHPEAGTQAVGSAVLHPQTKTQVQETATNAAAGLPDYSFYGGTDSNANSQLDSTTGAVGYGDYQSTDTQLESADPRYLESLYPGWKYDDATQQWYQVDTVNVQQITTETNDAVAVLGSDNVEHHHQHQKLSASGLQNNSHAEAVDGPTETEVAPQPKPVTEANDQPAPAPHKEVEHEPMPAHPQVGPVVVHPEPSTEVAGSAVLHAQTKSEVQETTTDADAAAMVPEGGSPGSEKGTHTAVKQVQWNDFGASTSAGEADLFGDLLPDGAEDGFFGAPVPGNQGVQASVLGTNNVTALDRSFSAGVGNSAAVSAGVVDYSFYGRADNNANSHFDSSATAAGYGDQSANAQLDSTDPKYLESLYPGWKYDAATQQWYQVDTPSAQSYAAADSTGAVAVMGSDSVQQHQQQFNSLYLQNTSHTALETIAEESSANATSWGAAPTEYPPNMLFYAEYPGWYFDTNTQQWQSLESYQQSIVQAATSPSALDGFTGAGHSAAHHAEDSYASTYSQSQWQPNSLANTMQPNVSGGNSLLGSSYSSNQQAENHIGQQVNAESSQPSINYKPHIDTFVPSTGQYTVKEGNHASYEGFKGNQSWYNGSEHSTNQEVGHRGFATSTDFQTGHKEFQPPNGHQVGHMAYEPSTRVGYGNSNGPQDFIPNESMYKTQIHADSSAHTHVLNNYWSNQTAMDFGQQQSQQFGFTPHEQRSSAGRPPHAVVTFGFGGKLVVLKEISSMTANFDSGNQGIDGPDMAVTNLFSSCKSSANVNGYGVHCMRNLPSESQIQATAQEVQNLLVSGRRKEALQYAQEGQLWGPALILALQLGDKVASAHSCYLVAELNIDSYSESARMCLIGADHLRCPRTFTSPEAIQRTEVYEYAKVLGNPQYILLPFQPYKLVYAYMLAEVGKVSDSLRYCQASLKVLKASGRTPELEAWKQLFSTLEERIRTHQQGGYATNLAAGKIVGKIFTSLDKSLSRMMGTQSAPMPPLPQGTANERDVNSPPDTKVVNSQSVMSMSPLMSSASEQSMSKMAGNSGPGREVAHNRSISEPDFGRTPQKQAAGSSKAQSTSGSGSSRFGWFVQKTVGLVSKSRRQAKLGEQNKFYYDEKLKRWVEEGAEVPAEEPPLPPPPTKPSFQNSIPESNLNGPPVSGGYTANGFAEARTLNPSEPSSGMPPMPPTQNQFSARGRMGVRSRYVDTFNKGGGGGGSANAFGAATMYSKQAAPSVNPLSGAKFFVPTPAAAAAEQMSDAAADAHSDTAQQDEPSSSSGLEAAFSSSAPPVPMQSTIQRYPSGDNIQRYPSMDNIMGPSDSAGNSMSRSRASSWSGTYPEQQLGSAAVSRSPAGRSPMMPGAKRAPHSRSSSNSSLHQLNGLGEDLHEVEL
nr:unnamed protein product [Digitaria exilis]CAB3469185.1 unnamed protein product [Digitaria exilis]